MICKPKKTEKRSSAKLEGFSLTLLYVQSNPYTILHMKYLSYIISPLHDMSNNYNKQRKRTRTRLKKYDSVG